MESPFQSTQILQYLLSKAGIPSVVIGGVAVGAWGEPYVTRDVAAIERGREVEVEPGITIRVCSPEDLIIYKLISTR